jgi:hypothetical protein
MAITSESQLMALLREMPSLSQDDREAMVDNAVFRDGRLAGLYIKPMRKCSPDEMNRFFLGAGAHMDGYGDPNGDEVRRDQHWSDAYPPCAPKDEFSCWVPALRR